MDDGVVPAEGGQIVVGERPVGRVTSARRSEQLGKAIGLAWVPPELAEEGSRLEIRIEGRLAQASVRLHPFYDPEGARQRS